MSDQEFDKGFLKEKLGGYGVAPPESVWKSISSRLAGGQRRTLLILSLSAAATLALAVTLGIHYFGPAVKVDRTLSETPATGPGEHPHGAMPLPPVSADDPERTEDGTRLQERPSRLEGSTLREMDRMAETNGISENLVNRVTAVHQPPPGESPGKPEEPGATLGHEREVSTSFEPVESTDTDLLLESASEEPAPVVSLPENELAAQDKTPSEPVEWVEEKKERSGRWILGAALSPLYSFRDAESGALPEGSDFESGMMAYAGGMQVSYRAAGRLAIETGVFFNKMGISIGSSGVRMFNSAPEFSTMDGAAERTNWLTVTNSVGNIVSNSGDIYVNNYKMNAATESNDFIDNTFNQTVVADEGIRQHLDYLELPLNLRYTVVDRTIELQLVGGVSTNFLVNNYVTMDTPSGPEEIGYLTNIRSVNYAGNAGVGMVYHFHKQFSLSLEPRFRYYLHSVNDATLPATRPYSLGLYTGLSYTF
jgi:hypothetical protein